MSIVDSLTKVVYKWVVLYPRFRNAVNWAYSDLLKMPQYHIQLGPGQIGEYVILVDDPHEVEYAASFLEDAHESANHREYRTFTGSLDGVRVSVTSTGIGGPPTAIAVHELAKIGATTFIYLGTGLAFSSTVKPGQLIIALGAQRDEGASLQYAPLPIPAIADIHVADCLQQACHRKGFGHQTGITRSADAFFPIEREGNDHIPGVLCTDINTASIFIVSSVLRKRAGALLIAGKSLAALTEPHIAIAVNALKQLIKIDKSKK